MNFESCILRSPSVLMEGALGERLKREYQLKIDGPVAMADLIYSAAGKNALRKLWEEYLSIAEEHQLPFLAATPTRRANKDRVAAGGYDASILQKNVDLLKEIRSTAKTDLFIGGLMGCRGDAYTGEGALDAKKARQFHAWQADLFRRFGTDFLFAGIMPVLAEAQGMAMAMADTGIPYVISLTIRRNGNLIDGTAISRAIEAIDRCVENQPPLFYMTNCVHPEIVCEALSHAFNQTEAVRTRFIGIQANTSPLSYAELDGSADLKCSAPEALAEGMLRLKRQFGFKVFGGCCGTDGRHLRKIAEYLQNPTKLNCESPYPIL